MELELSALRARDVFYERLRRAEERATTEYGQDSPISAHESTTNGEVDE